MRNKCLLIKVIIMISIMSQLVNCVSTDIKKEPETGSVWLVPSDMEVKVGSGFTQEIHVNTGNKKLAAYVFYITYPQAIVDVATELGDNGVDVGPDGFLIAVNAVKPGMLKIAGYDIYGKGPGENLHLLTIHWKAISGGFIKIIPEIISLADEKTDTIGTRKAVGAKIKVR